MRKLLAILMVLGVLFSICACGKVSEVDNSEVENSEVKDPEVQNVEKLISNLNDVTVDDVEAILYARDSFEKLTQEQKDAVENYSLLTNAETKFDVFVGDARELSNTAMLNNDPAGAIAALEKVLPIDASIQNDIDIIYEWCFDINGTLFIKPQYLYNGVKLVDSNSTDSSTSPGKLVSYYYYLDSIDSFKAYSEYAKSKFTLYDSRESDLMIMHKYAKDKYTTAIELGIKVFYSSSAKRLILVVDVPIGN